MIYDIIGRMNIKMVIQYEGTRYNGWQKQGNTGNTIQGKFEAVLSELAGYPVAVHGAGRTDAGVHAFGQVANFHIKEERDPEEVRAYLNRYLPDDIEVTAAAVAGERFHSRLNAVKKYYCYRIGTDNGKDVFNRRVRYHLGEKLDVEQMKAAAQLLLGEHDFKSFCSNKHMKKSTVRHLYGIDFQEDHHGYSIMFSGNGFLYHMVRILCGTLIEVGQGKRKPQEMTYILAGRNRQLAGFTAPAQGLMMHEVLY